MKKTKMAKKKAINQRRTTDKTNQTPHTQQTKQTTK